VSYSSEVLAESSLLAYYRHGEAAGSTTMADSSGNGRNGTYENSPTLGVTGLLTGDSDTCMEVTGSGNKRGRVASASWMNVATITVEAWINMDAVNDEMIVERDAQTGGGSVRSWQFRLMSGKFQFVANSSAVFASNATIVTGTRYHLAASISGTDVKLYVDGALDKTTSYLASLSTSVTQDIVIGASAFSGLYNADGRIDEVAVYAGVLSDARIAAHYTAGSTSGPAAVTGSLSAVLPW
jgi:hypothetical protein